MSVMRVSHRVEVALQSAYYWPAFYLCFIGMALRTDSLEGIDALFCRHLVQWYNVVVICLCPNAIPA